jgi:ATP-binding cassette subfamily F protein 3
LFRIDERRDNNAATQRTGDVSTEKLTDTKSQWLAGKEEQSRLRKLKSDLKETEDTIDRLEASNKEIDELLLQPEIYSDHEQLIELGAQKQANTEALETALQHWEDLSEQLSEES